MPNLILTIPSDTYDRITTMDDGESSDALDEALYHVNPDDTESLRHVAALAIDRMERIEPLAATASDEPLPPHPTRDS